MFVTKEYFYSDSYFEKYDYDLLLTLYYVNSDSTREVVHASMINDTLSTTKISFANQPAPSDVFKLVIMS